MIENNISNIRKRIPDNDEGDSCYDTFLNIVIVVLTLIILLIIFALVFYKKCYIFSYIVFAIGTSLSSIFICLFNGSLQFLPNLLNKCFKKDNNVRLSKVTIKTIVIALFSIFIVSSTVAGGAVVTITEFPKINVQNEVKPPWYIDYDLENIMDWDNYYFTSETKEKYLADNLEQAIRRIPYTPPFSANELDASEDYGGKAEIAVDHFKYLKKLMNEDSFVKGPVPEVCCKYIIQLRKEMDSVYITPDNRAEISNVCMYSAVNKITDNRVYSYEESLKYAWGAIVARISWGQYRSSDIDTLQNIYLHLSNVKDGDSEHNDMIVNALSLLKVRFEERPIL